MHQWSIVSQEILRGIVFDDTSKITKGPDYDETNKNHDRGPFLTGQQITVEKVTDAKGQEHNILVTKAFGETEQKLVIGEGRAPLAVRYCRTKGHPTEFGGSCQALPRDRTHAVE